MPAGLRGFAENQPLSKVMNAIRSLSLGSPKEFPLGDSAYTSAIWFVVIIAVSIPITTWQFKRRSTKG